MIEDRLKGVHSPESAAWLRYLSCGEIRRELMKAADRSKSLREREGLLYDYRAACREEKRAFDAFMAIRQKGATA